MTKRILCSLVSLAVPGILAAQVASATPQGVADENFGVGANIGLLSRATGSVRENGVRIQGTASIFRPKAKVGSIGGYEGGFAFTQVNNKVPGQDIRENAMELSALADVVAMARNSWRIDAGLGAVWSRSLGCTASGNVGSTAPGATPCPRSFAADGVSKLGYRGRLTSNWVGVVMTAMLGVEVSGNTVAAGNSVLPTLFFGARYAINGYNK
jgi:hypothetical protein